MGMLARRGAKCLSRFLALSICLPFCYSQVNVLTYHNDNARTGQNLAETILSPANVQTAGFGKLFSMPVDGKVDAQPLYVSAVNVAGRGVHNVVYAATEHDSVYAFDADNGTVYWQVSLLKAGETTSDVRSCSQVAPEIGATATPVIDQSAGPHGTIYVVAMSKDGAGNYYQRLHALDITTGAEQFGGPVDIAGSYPGSGDNSSGGRVNFDPKQYKSRPGMLLLNGVIYMGWGSHCDIRPYTGWLMGYNESTLQQTSIFNFAPNGSGVALWGAGGGIAADSQSNIFVQLANGTFDTNLNGQGFPSAGDFGNAFARLVLSGNQLQAADYWTMNNTVSESSRDQDLGSGSLILLPDLTDSAGTVRHLGTGAGKDGNVYIFDRDNMGKFNSASNNSLYQEIAGGLGGSEYASPAWFNGTVYYGAVSDVIRAFTVNAARLLPTPSSTTTPAHTFPYPGTTPSVSANGTGNAILWAVENSNPAVLHAYDATNLATELYNSSQAAGARDQFGAGNKYITPTIANGKVFVGTPNSVAVFGLLAGSQAMATPTNLAFGIQPVGASSASLPVTIINTGRSSLDVSKLLISGPNASDFIAAGSCSAGLAIGASCTISVSFQPSGPGNRTASLAFTDGASNPVQSVSLSGTGSGSSSTTTAFGATTMASNNSQTLTLMATVTDSGGGPANGGTVTFTLSSGTGPIGSPAISGTVANGRASVSYMLPANTAAGTYTIQAAYSGTSSLTGSNDGTRVLTIVAADASLGPLLFVPTPPCRVVDTRNPDGPSGGPKLAGGSAREFPIAGTCFSIPSSVAAYSLNVTVVPDSQLGYLTVWRAGDAQPSVSTLNSDGRVKANAAIVPAGRSGNVSVYASNPTHVILDLNGYFIPAATAPGSGLAFYPVAPCRVADTRTSAGVLGGPSLSGGSVRSFPVLSSACNIPSSAQAYALNLTAVPHSPLGYVTAWPAGQPQPLASALNAPTGVVTANALLTPAGAGGQISIFATNDTDLVIDISGYFAAPGSGLSLYLLPACRVLDTRSAQGSPGLNGMLAANVLGSACSVPANAQAVALNATVVPSGPFSYLTTWPDAQTQPSVSTLNALDSAITSNMAVIGMPNGYIDAFGTNPVQLILDITGYFAP